MSINYRIFHKCIKSILIIGSINLYNIIKEGIVLLLPFNNNLEKGIIKINEGNIKIIIIVSILIYIIFELTSHGVGGDNFSKEVDGKDKRNSIEYELLIGLGFIGILTMLVSNDLILLYIGLELYSFSIYLLILIKETVSTRRISIIYLIINSIASGILLIGYTSLYKVSGTLDINSNLEILKYTSDSILIPLFFIVISFLFKLGSVPFIFWVIRVYKNLDRTILIYQLIIPKFIFFYFLVLFLNYSTSLLFAYLLLIISIFTLIFGAIGGLYHNKTNLLLSYSSILNIGFILLSLSILLFNYNITNHIDEGFKNIIGEERMLWTIFNFFLIYFINLLSLFSALLLFNRSSLLNYFTIFYTNPFFFVCIIISILSFIGIPPLGGFYGKFYLMITLFSSNIYNDWFLFSLFLIILFLIVSIISSFYYFKFLAPSSSLKNKSSLFFYRVEPIFNSYILSLNTILILIYPYFFTYFYPLLQISII